MTKEKIAWILVCVVLSAIFTIWRFRKQCANELQQTGNYVAAEATIIKFNPARMSRYGIKVPRYGLTFTTADGKKYTQYNCELANAYSINDTLTVYYNPDNPEEPVTDKKY